MRQFMQTLTQSSPDNPRLTVRLTCLNTTRNHRKMREHVATLKSLNKVKPRFDTLTLENDGQFLVATHTAKDGQREWLDVWMSNLQDFAARTLDHGVVERP